MTAGWAGAGLAAAEALAAGKLEDRQCVDASHLVKMVDVHQSDGNS